MSVQILAEGGVNHNGTLSLGYELVDEAKKAGADVIKFQTYIPDKILRWNDPDYQMLSDLALPLYDFKKLARRCEQVGIEFMSTPECETTLKFLVEECGVKQIKIGSGDLTNTNLLFAVRKTNLPVLMSTGMAYPDEIYNALCATSCHGVTLMHCVSCYPCPPQDANLLAINTMRELFKDHGITQIGYSDHTLGPTACVAAVALGACVVEKHFTVATTLPGPDHAISANPTAFTAMVKQIRDLEVMLGHGRKEPCAAELEKAPLWRKAEDGKRGKMPTRANLQEIA